MLPNYLPGTRVPVRQHSAKSRPLAVGDVVVVNATGLTAVIDGFDGTCTVQLLSGMIIKRIHAICLGESPLAQTTRMFCIRGDNEATSADSRHFGLIGHDRIVGTVKRDLDVPVTFPRLCSACGR